eukprot:Nitzschia sp. Nitz4//scaffold22_size323478//319823//321217//NITZ4_000599-RA/size323478-processed-gene-0.494-mRNA-1//-1//CDS//3329543213//3695//frame0
MEAPEDKDQAIVHTPYGKGLVIRARKPATGSLGVVMYEIELLDWEKPDPSKGPKRPSMLYSPTKFPSIEPTAGCDVATQYGRGVVKELRTSDVVVEIKSWKLAGRSSVTCYLSKDSIQVLRPKRVYEMTVYEKVERAQILKEKATKHFSKKSYTDALQLYAEAVDAVRYIQHDKYSDVYARSDLLVVMITCCNNAATCCLQLHYWDRAVKFATNGMVLLDALKEKQGNSKILALLNKEGYSNAKLFGAWKTKSLLVVARASAERHDTEVAIENLQLALKIVADYNTEGEAMSRQLQGQEKETRKLLAVCKQRLKAERKKEKLRAQAMFGGSAQEKSTIAESKPDGDDAPDKKVEIEPTSQAKTPESLPDEKIPADSALSPPKGITPTLDLKEDTPVPTSAVADDEPVSKPRKSVPKRVSFADGTIPGCADDEPSFWDEHKEALILVGGLIFGSLCVHLLTRKRR